jgi:hypothetical protein
MRLREVMQTPVLTVAAAAPLQQALPLPVLVVAEHAGYERVCK